MNNLPEKEQQIRQTHAPLICQVVKACQNPEDNVALQPMLDIASQQNWNELVNAIKSIVAGKRDMDILNGLDEEDSVIISAILQGLQDPGTLPDANQQPSGAMAAPGIAHMIHAASTGDTQALQALGFMADQMTNSQGDMRQLGGMIKRLLDGERDLDILCKGMGTSGEKLMIDLVNELAQLSEQ